MKRILFVVIVLGSLTADPSFAATAALSASDYGVRGRQLVIAPTVAPP